MIVYDIMAIPELADGEYRLNPGEILALSKETGFLLYDSSPGDAPRKFDDDEIVVLDVNSKEGIKFCKEHNLENRRKKPRQKRS
jgi:hypothetical protein